MYVNTNAAPVLPLASVAVGCPVVAVCCAIVAVCCAIVAVCCPVVAVCCSVVAVCCPVVAVCCSVVAVCCPAVAVCCPSGHPYCVLGPWGEQWGQLGQGFASVDKSRQRKVTRHYKLVSIPDALNILIKIIAYSEY